MVLAPTRTDAEFFALHFICTRRILGSSGTSTGPFVVFPLDLLDHAIRNGGTLVLPPAANVLGILDEGLPGIGSKCSTLAQLPGQGQDIYLVEPQLISEPILGRIVLFPVGTSSNLIGLVKLFVQPLVPLDKVVEALQGMSNVGGIHHELHNRRRAETDFHGLRIVGITGGGVELDGRTLEVEGALDAQLATILGATSVLPRWVGADRVAPNRYRC